jgi:hypothetical protein
MCRSLFKTIRCLKRLLGALDDGWMPNRVGGTDAIGLAVIQIPECIDTCQHLEYVW